MVRIEKDDGSYMEGEDFYGDLQKQAFTFGRSSSGMMIVDEDNDEEE